MDDELSGREPGAETAAATREGDDLSSIAWVHEELRKSLEGAHKSLRRFLKDREATTGSDIDSVDPGVLRTARSQLHQGTGALELVGLPAAAIVLRAAESAVQRAIARPQSLNADLVADIERASFSLLDYLSRLLAGKQVSSLALFPAYRAVQEAIDAERVHPADLWPVDWRWRDVVADDDVIPRQADATVRAEFEENLLSLLRGSQQLAAAARMSELCAGLAAGSSHPQVRTFWTLAAAMFEAQHHALLGFDVFTKRVSSRLLAQLRLLQRGDSDVSERLARDLLFFAAQAAPAPRGAGVPRLAAVRRAYAFADQPPTDYTASVLGRFDPQVVAHAKKRVAAAKEAWSATAGGELHRLSGLSEQFSLVADSLRKLFPFGEAFANELQGAVAQTQGAQAAPPAALAMEVATSLLYVEAALDDGDFDDPALAERSRRLAERLAAVRQKSPPEPLEPWMEELYRRVSDRQTMGSVVQELRASLAEIEKAIDKFFRNPADHGVLVDVPVQLNSMRGVLSVLGMEQAAHALVRMRDQVEGLVSTEVEPERAGAAATFERLAGNLSALGFMIDMLSVQPQMAKSLFVFDDEGGTLAPVMGRSAPTAPPPAVGPVEPRLIEQAQMLAFTAVRDDVPLQDVRRDLERLSQEAQAADQPALAAAVLKAQEAIGRAGDAETLTSVRGELSEALVEFVATSSEPGALAPPSEPMPLDGLKPISLVEDLEQDDEMREIFLEEAREVLDAARGSLDELRDAPADVGVLTSLRRAFHTLKGSSRMVGLRSFGEAAWACEQLYNTQLAEQRAAEPPFIEFTEWALGYLGPWVDDIAGQRDGGRNEAAVKSAAERLGRGLAPAASPADFAVPAGPSPADFPDLTLRALPEVPALPEVSEVDEAAGGLRLGESIGGDADRGFAVASDGLPRLDLSADRAFAEPTAEVEPARRAGRPHADGEAMRRPSTFAELEPLPRVDDGGQGAAREAAGANEDMGFELDLSGLDRPREAGGTPTASPLVPGDDSPMYDRFDESREPALRGHESSGPIDLDLSTPGDARPLFENLAPSADADTAFDTQSGLLLDLSTGEALPAGGPVAAAGDSRSGVDVDLGDSAGGEIDLPLPVDDVKVVGPLRIGIPLFNIYLHEADELSRRLVTELAEWAMELHRPVGETAVSLAHSLAGSSATVGFADLSHLARTLEHALARSQAIGAGTESEARLFVASAEEIRRLLNQFAAGFLREPSASLLGRLADHEVSSAMRLDAATAAAELAGGRDSASPPDAGLPVEPLLSIDDLREAEPGSSDGDRTAASAQTAPTGARAPSTATGEDTAADAPATVASSKKTPAVAVPAEEPAEAGDGSLETATAADDAPVATPRDDDRTAVEASSSRSDATSGSDAARGSTEPSAGGAGDAADASARSLDDPSDSPAASAEPLAVVDAPYVEASDASTSGVEAASQASSVPSGEGDRTAAETTASAAAATVVAEPARVDDDGGPESSTFGPLSTLGALQPLGVTELKPLQAAPPQEAPRVPAPRPSTFGEIDEDIDAVDAVDLELFPIFEEEAQELLPKLDSQLRDWVREPTAGENAKACMRTLHTLKGGARLAGAMRLGEMAHRLETRIERLTAADSPVAAADVESLQGVSDAMTQAFEALRSRDAQAYSDAVAAAVATTPDSTAVRQGGEGRARESGRDDAASPPPPVPHGGTSDGAASGGAGLASNDRAIASNDADAGTGDRSEPRVAALLAPAGATSSTRATDAGAAAVSAPTGPKGSGASAASAPRDDSPKGADKRPRGKSRGNDRSKPGSSATTDAADEATVDWSRFARQEATLAKPAERAAAAQSAVRVRAPLLDRLVNQAGEVSITRSRIESGVGQIKGSLSDLTENLDRLRGQLRDIELQGEVQMSSRMEAAKAASQVFDPLEFDRFTRFQELTRMMAESVNDVATVQRTLQRSIEQAEDELVAQARLTRDLQDDLLRTRMVEFEGLSDRLYRVVRLAAKETGKQVRLDIVGGSIEVDRGVLDRMTGAFEHLLRNCVTHGIELPDARAAAGKDPTGTIVVALSHEGNEVGVEFRDDGAGLDMARIRAKAEAMKLVEPGAEHADGELANLIFTAGFSTAEHVTELAGRGVGMDVVRAETIAMGGRIETATAKGQGTSFKLLLPLTTAVTQVVMLRCGDSTVAVPSTLIEIVRRASASEVDAAYASGTFPFGEQAIPFFWLGALLELGSRPGDATARTKNVVVVRSAQQRIAIHVDEVLGNQEVVVKNLGPQLSRLPGLAGMTLLASGAVSLIYNPVALATLYGDAARAAVARTRAPGPGPASAPAGPVEARAAEAAQAPLILVVDDSLTVRRVTQRLLVREGYRVALAKDGLDALERLAEEMPQVVLSDIEMPRMDGFDLVRNIRADARWRSLPVVMITSRIAEKHREHALELGVDHYLGKPYSEEDLLALIGRYTALAEASA